MNVICVDDEKLVLADLVYKCQEIESIKTVTGFRKCQEALDFLKTNKTDIAFLDIDMPDMNGLDLAAAVAQISPQTAIVFTTGYSDFAVNAFKLHASGYLLKPVNKNSLIEEIKNIRKNQLVQINDDYENAEIYVQTFGTFDIFVNKVSVTFSRKKAKELLAYLVDKNGSTVTRKEMAAVLFEDSEYDRNMQSYLQKIIKDMFKSLEAAGAGRILLKGADSYAVVTTEFSCDSYEFLAGNPKAKTAYSNNYLKQYSWAEDRNYKFSTYL